MLRRDEWLHLAQALPIHGKRRHPHVGDRTRRENLIVQNLPDRWVAYCQSCREGGVVMKEHTTLTGTRAPKASTSLELPKDRVPLLEVAEHTQQQVWRFLARKGMDALYFPEGSLWYSDSRKRLLLRSGASWMGRDLTETSHQKWLLYSQVDFLGDFQKRDQLVLVEDAFSMLKVQWVSDRAGLRWRVVCCIGTAMKRSLLLRILDLQVPYVRCMMDGDAAGAAGAADIQKQLHLFGVLCDSRSKEGYDPKDLPLQDIEHALGGSACNG